MLYFSDTKAHCIRRLTEDGIIGRCDINQPMPTSGFCAKQRAVNKFDWLSFALTGALQEFAGACGHAGYTDAKGLSSMFSSPKGLCMSPNGVLAVVDSQNACIRNITPEGIFRPSPHKWLPSRELLSSQAAGVCLIRGCDDPGWGLRQPREH